MLSSEGMVDRSDRSDESDGSEVGEECVEGALDVREKVIISF